MNRIGRTRNALVLRTDFSNDQEWQRVCSEIETPEPVEKFRAYVTFRDDMAYKGLSIDAVIQLIDPQEHLFVFVVDQETLDHPEHPILCIDFNENHGRTFRVIPTEMWSVENNLSICNMDFSEFADNADPDGIFRGFE